MRSILFALAAICIRGDLRQMEHEEMMVKMKQAYPSLANTISAVSDDRVFKFKPEPDTIGFLNEQAARIFNWTQPKCSSYATDCRGG